MSKVKYTVKCLICGEKFINKVALLTHAVFRHNWNMKYKLLSQTKGDKDGN